MKTITAKPLPTSEVPADENKDAHPAPAQSTDKLKRMGAPPAAPAVRATEKPADAAPIDRSSSAARLYRMGDAAGATTKNDGEDSEDGTNDSAAIPVPPADFSALRAMGSATVDQVIDPLRIRLKDKRIIQLAGLDIPDLQAQQAGEISAQALRYLRAALENKPVHIYQTQDAKSGRTTNMGHELAHIALRPPAGQDGSDSWIQGALLAQGYARIRPSARNPEMADQMRALETAARESGKGLWAQDRYNLLTPETALTALKDRGDDWAVVQGRVLTVSMIRNTVYLNFGADWRTDFTIALSNPVRRMLEQDIPDLQALTGKTVEVHGWLESYNGPYIDLTHPAWLAVLPD